MNSNLEELLKPYQNRIHFLKGKFIIHERKQEVTEVISHSVTLEINGGVFRHLNSPVASSGLPQSAKNIWKILFHIREKSGNFVVGQEYLELKSQGKIREFENEFR